MKKARQWRLAAITASILLTAGMSGALMATSASASPRIALDNPGHFCYTTYSPEACLNAWNGGPWVKVYEGAASNDEFDATEEPNGDYYILFAGGGPWDDSCVGDAYNNQYRADTSLDPCPGGSNGNGGWGTNFIVSRTSQGLWEFYDVHWNDWLCPAAGYTNGSPFYLNATPGCYFQQSA